MGAVIQNGNVGAIIQNGVVYAGNVSGESYLIESDYSGLSYSYISSDGDFYNDLSKLTKLDIYHLVVGKSYTIILLPNANKNRARIGFFNNKTYLDFQQYIENPPSGSSTVEIYLCDVNLSMSDSQTEIQSVSFIPLNDGELVIGSNNQSYQDTQALCFEF